MMTSGELLRQLFRGYASDSDTIFLEAADRLVQNERAKNHRLLADDLQQILLSRPKTRSKALAKHHDIPLDRERGFPLLDVQEFRHDWSRLILPAKTLDRLQQIVRENQKQDLLAAAGLTPKQRILFCGPPGCGKTLTAQVIASTLHRPLVTVRFDAVVSSYLGETASNLRRVFEFVEQNRWVVLFDEFDAIGKDRNNPFEHGELKRVVNSLLQLMDAFRGDSVLIAATNYESLLDKAVWRRFDSVIPFKRPTKQDRILLMRLFLKSFDTSKIKLDSTAAKLTGATGADLEWFCRELARLVILDNRYYLTTKDVSRVLEDFKDRNALMQQATPLATDPG